MKRFQLQTKLKVRGDQFQAIEKLTKWIRQGNKFQTLIGVTGSGKTFTIANVISRLNKPVLVLSHNKTLAGQLYQEFKEFFPENAVHYFVSYYDYYQPEAYIPQTDTYIEKDASINEEIERLRHGATQALLSRTDVIVVSSVSCIYNIGSPENYRQACLELRKGDRIKRSRLLKQLVSLQYQRDDLELTPGSFRPRGEILEIFPPQGGEIFRLEFLGDRLEEISSRKLFAPDRQKIPYLRIFPAKHFTSPRKSIELAFSNIEAELRRQSKKLKEKGKHLEARRLEQRTRYDIEMMKQTGWCHGIENYSRHLEFRREGQAPWTLLDYFPQDFLCVIDESHMTIPQIKAMYQGDKARKETLIEFGFRLPSALDNRPLKFSEFEQKIGQTIFVSATPGDYELKKSSSPKHTFVAEQLIRPTGLLEPSVEVKPADNQIQDLLKQLIQQKQKKERTLISVLTKRSAENLAEFLAERGFRVQYLHSEIDTLQRPAILYDLRKGDIEVLVGVNLLREGLDLPEVSLVIIFDADKEGFLRNKTTLIQTMGRAARHINGRCLMYADRISSSMKEAIKEINRRRKAQAAWNQTHNIRPQTIKKELRKWEIIGKKAKTRERILENAAEELACLKGLEKEDLLEELRKRMFKAAENLEFEKAARLREEIRKLRQT